MTAALAIVGLYDELASGVVVVAAPGIEDAQSLGHAGYALWVFALPVLLATAIETPLALLSDRAGRRRVLRLALFVLAVALGVSALADRPWLLGLGLGLAGAASGVACASAQGELVSVFGGNADRAMTRWTTFAAAGDVLAPLLVGAVLLCGGTYRGGLLAVAALLLVQVLVTRPSETLSEPEPVEAHESWRQALGQPRLWALLLVAELCSLLDEIAVALAALRMTRDLGASEALTAASLTAFALGSLAGAAATDALVQKLSARPVLIIATGASMAALALVLVVRTPLEALGALALLGASAAPHFALIQAAAYEAVPGRPGLVNAAAQVFFAVEIALPLLAGLVAARYGLDVALACLALQPASVLVAAVTLLDRKRS
ncbi:MAG TPA: MFS transporter [Polyangiaceae bacterium]|nr:MFS transporter [Polyangiaceae bacterium]